MYSILIFSTKKLLSSLVEKFYVRPYERYLNLYFPISEAYAIFTAFNKKYFLGTIIYGALLRLGFGAINCGALLTIVYGVISYGVLHAILLGSHNLWCLTKNYLWSHYLWCLTYNSVWKP